MRKLLVCFLCMFFVSNAYAGSLKLLKSSEQLVSKYLYSVKRNGILLQYPVVKVGDTFYAYPLKKTKSGWKVIQPKVSLYPINSAFIPKVNSILTKAVGKSYVDNNGRKQTLYIVFDALCPYCIHAEQAGKMQELQKKFNLAFIPLVIHGKPSVQGLSCMYQKAKTEGIAKAVSEVYSWKTSSWKDYIAKLYKCKADAGIDSAVKKVSNILLKNNIDATPTFIMKHNGKYYEAVGDPSLFKLGYSR